MRRKSQKWPAWRDYRLVLPPGIRLVAVLTPEAETKLEDWFLAAPILPQLIVRRPDLGGDDGEIAYMKRSAENSELIARTDEKGRRYVTVDTGGPDDLFAGALVTWLHIPRGGYGYAVPVPSVVLGANKGKGVIIEVIKKDGTKAIRSVQVKSLRWRK